MDWDYVPAINEHEVLFIQDLKDGARILKYGMLVAGVAMLINPATMPFGISILAGAAVSYAAQKLTEIPKLKGFDDSKTYSWGGIQNTIGEGSVVPVVYGHHVTGGLVVETWTQGDVTENATWYLGAGYVDTKYTLRALIALSEGPICAVNENNVKLNKQTIDNYGDDCTVFSTLGEIDQEVIDTDFSEIKRQYTLEAQYELENNSESTDPEDAVGFTYDCYDKCNQVLVNLSFPNGIYDNSEYGDKREVKFRFAYQLLSSDPDDDPWTLSTFLFSNAGHQLWLQFKNKAPFQIDHKLKMAHYDNWRIRVWRYDSSYSEGNHDAYVTHVVETTTSSLNYPATALLGLEAVATEQLNGRLPTITTEIWGRRLDDIRGYGQGLPEQTVEYTFADSENSSTTWKTYEAGDTHSNGSVTFATGTVELWQDGLDARTIFEDSHHPTVWTQVHIRMPGLLFPGIEYTATVTVSAVSTTDDGDGDEAQLSVSGRPIKDSTQEGGEVAGDYRYR